MSLAGLFSLVKRLWVRPKADPTVERLKGASLRLALTLLADNRLDLGGFKGTDPPVYYKHLKLV